MLVYNHTHIRHIMLYHFVKGWKAAHSFRNLNELFGEQSAKVDAGNGLPVSNLATLAGKISQEEVDHRISTTRHFWQPLFPATDEDTSNMYIHIHHILYSIYTIYTIYYTLFTLYIHYIYLHYIILFTINCKIIAKIIYS